MASSFKTASWLGRSAIPRDSLLAVCRGVSLCILLLGLTVFVAQLGGAYRSELGFSDADEPAHYVTGLMIHDYLASGVPQPPLAFAIDYYLHYPKVALGVWPPFFYVIEALWMLLFSPSHGSVFLLAAAITTVCALILLLLVQKEFGTGLALVAATLYILLPDVQTSSSSVMVDGLVATLELTAVLQLARYIERQRGRFAYAFGCLAALGALSKANALALMLVPLIAVAVMRRWHLLARKEIWFALLIVVATAAPWNYFLIRVAANSVGLMQGDVFAAFERGANSLQRLAAAAGVLLPFAAIGIWRTIVVPYRSRRISPVYGSMFALIASVILFHAAVPSTFAPRYLLPCFAPMLLFVVSGFEWVALKAPLGSWSAERRTTAVVAAALIAFFAFQFSLVRRGQTRFGATAERLAGEVQSRVILVSADPDREGMAVAEIAMRDLRPRHYVLRGSKVLSESDWAGKGYRSLFETPQQISSYLDSVPVDFVLMETNTSRVHSRLLAEALRSRSGVWRQASASAEPLSLWERVHPIAHGKPNIRVGMKYTLHRTLSEGSP